jgi:hypothetical protein
MLSLLALVLLAAHLPADTNRVAPCQALTKTTVSPTTVGGRLYAASGGGSGSRVAVAGAKRIVWLTATIEPAIPDTVGSAFTLFDEELHGDFTLVPLQPDTPGVMRDVCFVAAGNLRPSLSRDAQTAAAGGDAQWSEADLRWLDTWREAALDALMPVKARNGQTIAYRRYRDLYQGAHEVSFSVALGERPQGHATAATLVEPAGRSIQDQLLRLHAADREAALQTLLPKVTLRRTLVERSCPALDAQLRAVPRIIPAVPITNATVLHPVIHRIVITTTLIDADATVLDPKSPVARWADRTIAAIRACGTVAPPSS